jgi:hypothetical protein
MSLFNNHISKQKMLKLGILFGILSALITFIVYQQLVPRADEIRSVNDKYISNVATLEFCAPAEDSRTCSPTQELYSNKITSDVTVNPLIVITPTPTPPPSPTPTPPPPPVSRVCIKVTYLGLQSGQYQHDHIALEIKNASSGVTVISTTEAGDQVSTADGTITFNKATLVSRLNNTTPYEIKLKPRGFLTRKLSNVTNILGTCIVPGTTKQFYVGDFDGNNKIELFDFAKAIGAYNDEIDDIMRDAYRITNGKPTLNDFARLIFLYNENPNGE